MGKGHGYNLCEFQFSGPKTQFVWISDIKVKLNEKGK